ncbi:MAG: cytochrome c, partial [Thiotrichales bacterium]|nr:cytochrome c [Thiotrichales bacterium]
MKKISLTALSLAVGVAMGGLSSVANSAPSLSAADFERAKNLYFERCAGCHGVLRKGATGKNLEPKSTLELGQERLEKILT